MEASKQHRKKIIVIMIVLLVVVSFVLGIIFANRINSPKSSSSGIVDSVEGFVEEKIIGSEGIVTDVSAKANLEKIIKISQLRTFTYNYNSICDVTENRKIVYHVAYKGTVEMGIEADDIQYIIDEQNLSIKILLPEVTIQEPSVDPGSLKYIFVDDSYDTPSVGTRAQSYCLADLRNKIADEPIMMELAKENTKREVEAMFGPIVHQYYSQYTFVVEFAADEGETT